MVFFLFSAPALAALLGCSTAAGFIAGRKSKKTYKDPVAQRIHAATTGINKIILIIVLILIIKYVFSKK